MRDRSTTSLRKHWRSARLMDEQSDRSFSTAEVSKASRPKRLAIDSMSAFVRDTRINVTDWQTSLESVWTPGLRIISARLGSFLLTIWVKSRSQQRQLLHCVRAVGTARRAHANMDDCLFDRTEPGSPGSGALVPPLKFRARC